MKGMEEGMHGFQKSIEELDSVMKMEYVTYGARSLFLNNGEIKNEHLTPSFQHLMIVIGFCCSSRKKLYEKNNKQMEHIVSNMHTYISLLF